MIKQPSIPIIDLIKCSYYTMSVTKKINYFIIPAYPAAGVFFVTPNSPHFLQGRVSMRGKKGGRYPYNYPEMIDSIFGREENTIEVCSGSVSGRKSSSSCLTVDINPQTKPDLVCDAQTLDGVPSNEFNRWRCDPPYNANTARLMYGTSLPATALLLRAGARVCKVGALLFLLLGNSPNYQPCPPGIKRIGYVNVSIVPNNETRDLNIYYKYA